MPSMQRVGALEPYLNSKSLAADKFKNISVRFEAIVISLTGKANSPFSIQ